MIQLQRFSLFANYTLPNFDFRTSRFITDFVIFAHTITDSTFDTAVIGFSPRRVFWVIIHDLNEAVVQTIIEKFSPWIRGFLLRTSFCEFVEQPNALFAKTKEWKDRFALMNIKLGWCFDGLCIPKRNSRKPFPWIPRHDFIDLCYILPPTPTRLLFRRKHILRIMQILNCFAIPSYIMVIPYLEQNPVELDLHNLHGYSLESYESLPIPFSSYDEPFVRRMYYQ